jgi:hypothetical protein
MKQTIFEFAKDVVSEQLELFSTDIYDNRVQRLKYSIKISKSFHGWSAFNLKNVKECVKLFQVSHQTVYECDQI